MTIRNRVRRLERDRPDDDGLPPRFWDALVGAVPADRVHPATAELIRRLCVPTPRDRIKDPLAEALAARGLTPPPTEETR